MLPAGMVGTTSKLVCGSQCHANDKYSNNGFMDGKGRNKVCE